MSGGACLAPMTAYESISIFIGILALLMSFGIVIIVLLKQQAFSGIIRSRKNLV